MATQQDEQRPAAPEREALLPRTPNDGNGNGNDGTATPATAVYARRYWVLFLFSLAGCLQGWYWVLWSPVEQVTIEFYGWSESTFDWILQWGTMVALVLIPFVPWIIDRLGVRASLTCCSVAIGIGSALRAATLHHEIASSAIYLVHTAAFFNALAGPFMWALPSKLSALWFPASQRTTATAWSTMAQNIGTVLGGIAGVVVGDIKELERFIYISSVFGITLMVLALFDHLWSAEPPLPPSLSTAFQASGHFKSDSDRTFTQARVPITLRASLSTLWSTCKNFNFLLLVAANALATGSANAWSAAVDPLMSPLGYTQSEAAIVLLVSTAFGLVGTVVFGYLADELRHGIKWLIIGLISLAIAASAWFASLILSSNHQMWQLCVSSSLTMFAALGSTALFYEESVEAVYPTDAVTANTIMAELSQAVQVLYLVGNSELSDDFMPWLLGISMISGVILMLFFKEQSTRRAIDV